MSYRSLVVSLELGKTNAGLLQAARSLAETCKASVLGVASCKPLRDPYSGYGDAFIAGEIVQMDRDEIDRQSGELEASFRAAMAGMTEPVHWRTLVYDGDLSVCLAADVRGADLILAAAEQPRTRNPSRTMDIAGLVMHAGRPVLILPGDATSLNLRRVMVGWKNTRETRRAIADALPMLAMAEHVSLVGIVEGRPGEHVEAELADVKVWLARHGITADTMAIPGVANAIARLDEQADKAGADLIVAGAYGHTRAREWALGGVTRDILMNGRRAVLLSH